MSDGPLIRELAWKVYHITTDPLSAVRHLMAERSTGQIILHLTQGKVGAVEWRERVKHADGEIPLDNL